MTHFRIALALLAIVVITSSCSQPAPAEPPDTRAQDETAIRDTAKAWSAAAQAKDPEKFVSFYAEDAVLMLPSALEISGKAALRDAITTLMKDPNFALSFETKSVEVARSGDLAYELSTYTITSTDEKTRKPVTSKGHGIAVWKKQADGTWKARVDTPVEEPAAPPAAPAAKK